jgi:MFS family permease
MPVHKNIKLLTWHNFFTDFRPYAPIAIIYFSDISGSFALGLSVFSIEMLSSSIFELPTGIISDFVGRRKTVIAGSLMAVLALIFYAIGTHYYILAVGSIFAGLARSFYSGNNSALLHDSLKEHHQEEEYAEYSGKTSSMFQWALAGSALLGGVIAYFSFPAVMWISVLPQVVCLWLSLRMIEPKVLDFQDETNIYTHLKEAVTKFKENSKLRLLSIASILDYGIGETMYQFNSAFIALFWPVWAIGVSKTLSNLFAAIGMQISGKVTKSFGKEKSLFISNIGSSLLGLTAVSFPSVVSPLLISSTSFPYGISSISKDALFQKEFTDKQRATMGSLTNFAGSLFFAVFAFAFGFIADKLVPSTALLIGELLALPTIYFYWKVFKRK